MPLQKVSLRPGIQGMATSTANEGGWSAGNLVRFRAGLPEKMRGWKRYLQTTFLGKVRQMLVLYELAGDALLAVGTSNHLYIIRGGTTFDLTPVDRTLTAATNGVQTVQNSASIQVTTTAPHGLSIGDFVTFDTISGQSRTPSALAIGGLAVGLVDMVVDSVASPTIFTALFPFPATSNATGGSGTTVTCYMAAGPNNATPGLGYGAGGYGVGPYGIAASVAAITLPARMWSLEAWGQTLLAVPLNGRLLAWSPDASGNVSSRAAYVVNTTPANGPPRVNGGCIVGMPERHALIFGCSDLNAATNYDPLLVRFSDVEDYTTWNATSTNSAGSFRLQGGSAIMGWLNSTLQTLVWTDTSLWTVRFIGLPYVYSFNKLDGNCGLIAQNARAELGGVVYWMGQNGFWRFQGGTPQQLPCSLQDVVFDRLNRAQQTKVYAGVNSANGEVIWFYPVGEDCDAYIIYNTRENIWYGGTMARSVWLDRGNTGTPLAATPDGKLYLQETGTDADGDIMFEYLESGFFDLEDGTDALFLDKFLPDFQGLTGTLQLTIKVTEYPSKPPRVLGPYTIKPDTKFIPFRARGRQASLRIERSSNGTGWRLGACRISMQPDGKRG